MIWAVFRNNKPEKCQDDITKEMVEQYRKTNDISFLIVAHSVINVFLDENLAQVCKSSLEMDYPKEKFEVVPLHPILETREWS